MAPFKRFFHRLRILQRKDDSIIDPQDPQMGENVAAIYQRHPLSANTTRVLRILPPTRPDMSDIISCRLSVISMDPPPDYRALSYVWGDPSATKVILVDDTPFKVRINLWNYLVQARSEERCTLEPRYIWVDAVCINQDDLDERSKQVTIMGQIYSKASEVCAWLGVGTKENLEAMRDIPDIDWKAKPSLCDETLEPICALLDLEYWSRLWIFQEYVLANSIVVQCGPKIIPGVIISSMASAPLDYMGCESDTYSRLESTRAWLIIVGRRIHHKDRISPGLSFTTALMLSLGSRCTDPHDHVYALLSIAEVSIVPDYNKSLLQLLSEVAFHKRLDGTIDTCDTFTLRRLQEKFGLQDCAKVTQWLRTHDRFLSAADMGCLQDGSKNLRIIELLEP